MEMTYIRTTVLADFPTYILNGQVLSGKEKYLLNSSHEKLKNKVALKQMSTIVNLSLPRTNE